MWLTLFLLYEFIQFIEGVDIKYFISFIFFFFLFRLVFYNWKPFRNKKFKFKCFFIILLLIFAVIIGLNYYSIKKKGKLNSEITKFESFVKNTMVNSDCKFYSNKSSNFFDDSLTKEKFMNCKKKFKKFILIIGDSHAGNLYNAIAKSTNYEFILGLIKDGCRLRKIKLSIF